MFAGLVVRPGAGFFFQHLLMATLVRNSHGSPRAMTLLDVAKDLHSMWPGRETYFQDRRHCLKVRTTETEYGFIASLTFLGGVARACLIPPPPQSSSAYGVLQLFS